MKKPIHHLKGLMACLTVFLSSYLTAQVTGTGSRMNEVFKVTELTHGTPSPTRFWDPWEVTYGPDDSLWVTEAKNYKVFKVGLNGLNPPRMILDISQGSTFFSSPTDQAFNLQFNLSNGGYVNGTAGSTVTGGAPQGGLAGLAIHPNFLSGSPYVFISYIWKFTKHLVVANKTTTGSTTTTSTGTPSNGGVYYQNSLVRFTYNFSTGKLGSPMMVCDTLPGSSDHNSQRIIIAPISGTYYLFYANGDMGAGQFGNQNRVENAQNLNSYEGKILRFNLDPDGDTGPYDKWIPGTNPFNVALGKQSAVFAFGFRNNQGLAYAKINGNDFLYGQQHGPFSDDEINVIHGGGNYGHPLVIGYKKDGNYNGSAAGNPLLAWGAPLGSTKGGLPVIVDETHNADSMNQVHPYYDPIFSYFPAIQGTTTYTNTTASPTQMASVRYIYYWFNNSEQSNTYWASEAPSGMDVYTKNVIPGWKNSLVSSVMKGAPANPGVWRVKGTGAPNSLAAGNSTYAAGKLMRLKLNTNGDGLVVSPTYADSTLKASSAYAEDTVAYFASQNRFRDLAFAPDGLSMYAVIDSSQTTSGPTATNPATSLCRGCLLKYTFLGYADVSGESSLSSTIPVTVGTAGTCNDADTIVVNADNKNLWVPITGPDGNILAEIYPNGNLLDTVISSFYVNTGGIRADPTGRRILDRNIKITPKNQPSIGSPVKVRLYLTNAEYTALQSNSSAGVTGLASLIIRKNNDACGNNLVNTSTTSFTPTYYHDFGTTGKVLQIENVPGFSSFYIGSNLVVLPVDLIFFNGTLENNTTLLKWETSNETNADHYVVERGIDGNNFLPIGQTAAKGNSTSKIDYRFTDFDVMKQSSSVVYYRLKMVDKDGAFKYSDVVKVTLPFVTGRVNLFPNPAKEEVSVTIDAPVDGKANWKLLDNAGRVVMESKTQVKKGTNSFSININTLSAGVYFMQIKGAELNENIKLQKL